MFGRPSCIPYSCREVLLEVWEWWGAFPEVWVWSGGPLGCPGVVGRQSWMFRSGREALPDVREWLAGYPGCPGVF